jgi:hypothetical protein
MTERNLEKDLEEISIRRGLVLYDTEEISDKRCEDCGRLGHCEC